VFYQILFLFVLRLFIIFLKIEKSKRNLIYNYLIAVFFSIKSSFKFEDKDSCRAYEEETECQLVCYTKTLQTM